MVKVGLSRFPPQDHTSREPEQDNDVFLFEKESIEVQFITNLKVSFTRIFMFHLALL